MGLWARMSVGGCLFFDGDDDTVADDDGNTEEMEADGDEAARD